MLGSGRWTASCSSTITFFLSTAKSATQSDMFASLNRFIARLDGDPASQQESRIRGAFGFQVLRNTNDEIPLEPWYDFIVGINGREIVCCCSYLLRLHVTTL